jgi:hypothetical protein
LPYGLPGSKAAGGCFSQHRSQAMRRDRMRLDSAGHASRRSIPLRRSMSNSVVRPAVSRTPRPCPAARTRRGVGLRETNAEGGRLGDGVPAQTTDRARQRRRAPGVVVRLLRGPRDRAVPARQRTSQPVRRGAVRVGGLCGHGPADPRRRDRLRLEPPRARRDRSLRGGRPRRPGRRPSCCGGPA